MISEAISPERQVDARSLLRRFCGLCALPLRHGGLCFYRALRLLLLGATAGALRLSPILPTQNSLYRLLLKELGLLAPRPTLVQLTDHERQCFTDDLAPAEVFQDNVSSITIIQDLVYNGRTKHIDIRLKQLREQVRIGSVLLRYINTNSQIADALTKGLSAEQFRLLVELLMTGGVINKN